jgi:hypothetical protein
MENTREKTRSSFGWPAGRRSIPGALLAATQAVGLGLGLRRAEIVAPVPCRGPTRHVVGRPVLVNDENELDAAGVVAVAFDVEVRVGLVANAVEIAGVRVPGASAAAGGCSVTP